jgi:hypothetical protein
LRTSSWVNSGCAASGAASAPTTGTGPTPPAPATGPGKAVTLPDGVLDRCPVDRPGGQPPGGPFLRPGRHPAALALGQLSDPARRRRSSRPYSHCASAGRLVERRYGDGDLTELPKGLPGDARPSPHWGFVFTRVAALPWGRQHDDPGVADLLGRCGPALLCRLPRDSSWTSVAPPAVPGDQLKTLAGGQLDLVTGAQLGPQRLGHRPGVGVVGMRRSSRFVRLVGFLKDFDAGCRSAAWSQLQTPAPVSAASPASAR